MSTLKVGGIRGVSASSDAITVANDGTCTANITNNLSNRNKIMNGEFLINQRGNSTNGSNSGYFGPDRFKWRDVNSSTVFTISQSTDTPDGFAFSYHADCTTADTSFSENEFISIQHKLEGQDVQDFAKGTSSAKQYTLSFHVKSDVTGTYVVAFQDLDNNRMCCATYTVSSADTWEKKTITIPADTTGAFDNDNAASLQIQWCLGAGSGYTSGTLQTVWGSDSSPNTFVGQTANLGSSTDNDFRLTGVQLEVGSVATDFEHRSSGDELIKCQRYFYQATRIGTTSEVTNAPIAPGFYLTASDYRAIINFPVEMRAAPTLSSNDNTSSYYIHFNANADVIDRLDSFYNTKRRSIVRNTAHASGVQGYPGFLHQETGDSNLNFSADL